MLPTLDALNEQVDREFHQQYPDAPEHLDPNDSEQSHHVQEWTRIRDEVANRLTDEAFYELYPIGRRLDPNDPDDATYVYYWNDMHQQLRGEVGYYDWSSPPPAPDATAAQDAGTAVHEAQRFDGGQVSALPDDVSALGTTAQAGGVLHTTADSDDARVADGYFNYESLLLQHWKYALDSFHVVMTSSTSEETNPDFAKVMLDVFTEKVVGHMLEKIHADILVDVVKGIAEEASRAKAASTSMKLRDFYTSHVSAIASLETKFETQRNTFATQITQQLNSLLQTDLNRYAEAQAALLSLYVDAEERLRGNTNDVLLAHLSGEWVRTTTGNYGNAGRVMVKVSDGDFTILDVRIDAEDGDKMLDHMASQPGGFDVWNFNAPKGITVMGGSGAIGTVWVDGQNRYDPIPADDVPTNHKLYDRIIAAGGLKPWHR